VAYDRATAVNNILPAIVTLTTDQMTGAAADALAAVLHAATVTVERRTFLPMPDAAHPWGVLLVGVAGPLPALARLLAPWTAPAGVAPALATALGGGGGERAVPATLQLKADDVFVSIRGREIRDVMQALDALPAQLACLDTRREERRLVYSDGAWRIDP